MSALCKDGRTARAPPPPPGLRTWGLRRATCPACFGIETRRMLLIKCVARGRGRWGGGWGKRRKVNGGCSRFKAMSARPESAGRRRQDASTAGKRTRPQAAKASDRRVHVAHVRHETKLFLQLCHHLLELGRVRLESGR